MSSERERRWQWEWSGSETSSFRHGKPYQGVSFHEFFNASSSPNGSPSAPVPKKIIEDFFFKFFQKWPRRVSGHRWLLGRETETCRDVIYRGVRKWPPRGFPPYPTSFIRLSNLGARRSILRARVRESGRPENVEEVNSGLGLALIYGSRSINERSQWVKNQKTWCNLF